MVVAWLPCGLLSLAESIAVTVYLAAMQSEFGDMALMALSATSLHCVGFATFVSSLKLVQLQLADHRAATQVLNTILAEHHPAI